MIKCVFHTYLLLQQSVPIGQTYPLGRTTEPYWVLYGEVFTLRRPLETIRDFDPLQWWYLRSCLRHAILLRRYRRIQIRRPLQSQKPFLIVVCRAYLPKRPMSFRAVTAASMPLLPCLPPERSVACSMVLVVRTPKMIGTSMVSALSLPRLTATA